MPPGCACEVSELWPQLLAPPGSRPTATATGAVTIPAAQDRKPRRELTRLAEPGAAGPSSPLGCGPVPVIGGITGVGVQGSPLHLEREGGGQLGIWWQGPWQWNV